MNFFMPTKLYEETECVKKHAKEIAALGTKALIVTGRNSAVRCGALKDLEDVLSAYHCSWVVFNQVEENPSTTTIMEAAKLGLAEQCDFVAGIGGGSPMDAAKAVALMMKHPDWTIDKLYAKGQDNSALPIITIPTTCGTGSEATGVSVLTNHKIAKKGSIPYRLFPTLSLVDGKYLKNVPSSILANTAIDALAHLVESFLTAKADDYSKMFVREGLRVWAANKAVLAGEKEATTADLLSLMHASTLAGMAIAHTGTSLPHALSYTLTYDLHIPHGAACGYFLKGFLDAAPQKDREELLHLAGFADTDEYESFFCNICGSLDVSDEILQKAVNSVVADGKHKTAAFQPIGTVTFQNFSCTIS